MKRASAEGKRRPGINWQVALLALVSAITFWSLHTLDKRYNATLSFPIVFEYEEPEKYILVQAPPNMLTLAVTGVGWDLLRKTATLFEPNHLSYTLVNPTEIKALSEAQVQNTLIKQLAPVRLNNLTIDTIFFDIQARTTRTIKLAVDGASIPLNNNCRVVSSISLNPDSLVIIGAESYINALPEQHIVLIDESVSALGPGLKEINLPISLPWPKLLQAETSDVRVSFEVSLFERKQLTIGISKVNFPRWRRTNVLLENTEVTVSYTAPVEAALLAIDAFEVVANYTLRNLADSTVALELERFPQEAIDPIVTPAAYKIYYVPKR